MAYRNIHGVTFDSQGSIIELVMQIFYIGMINPKNNDYLPTLVPKIDNPSLVPYQAVGPWTLSNLSGPDIATSADQICIQATPSQYNPAVGRHAAYPKISLNDISIIGLNNVQPELPVVTDPNSDSPKVSVTLNFCTIKGDPTIPEQITIIGNFKISQDCCIPARGVSSCLPGNPTYNTSGDGTFTATLGLLSPDAKIQMLNEATITLAPDQSFLVTITKVTPAISTAALTVSVTINSSDPHRATFEKLAEEALNSDSGKLQILAAVENELTQSSTLASISSMLTKQINSILSNQINNILS